MGFQLAIIGPKLLSEIPTNQCNPLSDAYEWKLFNAMGFALIASENKQDAIDKWQIHHR